jgi:hypothetical protein
MKPGNLRKAVIGGVGLGAASAIMKANQEFGSGKAPSGPPTTGTTKAPAKATGTTKGSTIPTSQVTSETQSQAMLNDGAPATGSWITKGGVRVWVSKGPEGITTWGLEPSPGEWETAPDTAADLQARLAAISAKGPIGNPWITAKQNLSGAPVPTPDEAEAATAAETDVDTGTADYVPPPEGKSISPGSVGTPVTEGGMTTEGAVTKDGDVPLYAADGTESGLVVTKDGEVKKSSGGSSGGDYNSGGSSYRSGGSSYSRGGYSSKKKKKKKTSGSSSQMWEGFPFNRPPSPIRQHILDAIAASKTKGAAKKGG